MSESALILLAAGAATRMGSPKQLLEYRGQSLVRRAVLAAIEAACSPVVVVTGAHAPQVETALAGLPVTIAHNPRWPEGMGTSIQAGLHALPETCPAAILTLADQPLVDARVLRTLIDQHRSTGKPIVSARYEGTVGVPVLFAREAFGGLLALAPDQGCKGVILRNSPVAHLVDCPEAAFDVDTADDYARLLASGS